MTKEKRLRQQLDRSIEQFVNNHPELTLEECLVLAEKMAAVSTLPPALFNYYRNSGMTVEEVYELIKDN